MTVSASPVSTIFNLSGSNLGPFASGFVYEFSDELKISLLASGTRSVLASNKYTINGATPLISGGNVSLDASLLPVGGWVSGDKLYIERRTRRTQVVDFPSLGRFDPQTGEEALDRLTRTAQESASQTDRSLMAPIGEAGFEIPDAATRAGKIFSFDGTGAPSLSRSLSSFDADVQAVSNNKALVLSAKTSVDASEVAVNAMKNQAQASATSASVSATAAAASASEAADIISRNVTVVLRGEALVDAKILAAFNATSPLILNEVGDLVVDPTAFGGGTSATRMAYLTSAINFVRESTGKTPRLLIADGLHTVNGYIDLVGGRPIEVTSQNGIDLLTISAISMSALTTPMYEITVTVTSALRASVVVGWPVGMQNVRGNNSARAFSGAGVITWIAGDRLSFKYTTAFRKSGVVAPTTISTGVSNGVAESRVVVPRAALVLDGAGRDGTAIEGWINLFGGAVVTTSSLGFAFARSSGGHDGDDLFFARDTGSTFRLLDYTVMVGAEDRVVRLFSGAHCHAQNACFGGVSSAGATNALFFAQDAATVLSSRCSMGGTDNNGSAGGAAFVVIDGALVNCTDAFIACEYGVRSYGGKSYIKQTWIENAVIGLHLDNLSELTIDPGTTVNNCTTGLSIERSSKLFFDGGGNVTNTQFGAALKEGGELILDGGGTFDGAGIANSVGISSSTNSRVLILKNGTINNYAKGCYVAGGEIIFGDTIATATPTIISNCGVGISGQSGGAFGRLVGKPTFVTNTAAWDSNIVPQSKLGALEWQRDIQRGVAVSMVTASIAHDAVFTLNLSTDTAAGSIEVAPTNATGEVAGQLGYNTALRNGYNHWNTVNSGYVVGPLTGTTGASGKLSYYIHDNAGSPQLQVENRTGGGVSISLLFKGGAAAA